MKRVLLVGGAGYVGSVLARELLDRGYTVRVLDRMYFGGRALADIRDRVESIVADMRLVPDGALDGIDVAINVGGLSNDPTAEYNPEANYEINTVAAVALARKCLNAGVQRYILASSCSLYDRGPVADDQDVLFDEESPVAPRTPYPMSKYTAERQTLELASSTFCVSALRKATLYGFSHRMRYDLVVNTFVKDALSHGRLTLHRGGAMWRPLADVRDAARAYVALIEADAAAINGEVFNLVGRNLRVSEIALRVQDVLRDLGIRTEVMLDHTARPVRSYRVSGEKLARRLGFTPSFDLDESVREMVGRIREHDMLDFDHPRYYNIRWMQLLEEASDIIGVTGSVFYVQTTHRRPRILASASSKARAMPPAVAAVS